LFGGLKIIRTFVAEKNRKMKNFFNAYYYFYFYACG